MSGSERPERAPLLDIADLEKRFGGVHALRGAEMRIQTPGVVHALLGENGSGKSTMLGIVSGQLRPDRGRLAVGGEEVQFHSPVDALERGIAMVSQEIAVADHLTITENILMGRRLLRGPAGIDWRGSHELAGEILDRLGLDYDPRRPVARLRPDQRQMVEIARALSMDARLLIFDEPTSSLTDDQVEALFRAIRHLKGQEISTIFVSHRLAEVFAICDELTILRDGETVAAGPVSSWNVDSVVEAMIGAAAEKEAASKPAHDRIRPGSGLAAAVLEVRGLCLDGAFEGVDLELHAGEIVGLVGLVGSGRGELLEAIFGARKPTAGTRMLEGELLPDGDERAAIAGGLGFLPPDRKSQGLVPEMSVTDNLMMISSLGRRRLAPPRRRQEAEAVSKLVKRLRLRTEHPHSPVATLSGGNQQKVVFGKWLGGNLRAWLLDEPTRGVDVGAKAEIHNLIRDAADQGVALLVSSSETDEVLALSDRVLVMFRGRIVAALTSTEASEAKLARLAAGHA